MKRGVARVNFEFWKVGVCETFLSAFSTTYVVAGKLVAVYEVVCTCGTRVFHFPLYADI